MRFFTGIYLWSNPGSLTMVVDESIQVPATGAVFSSIGGAPSLSNGDVAFLGWNAVRSGVYMQPADATLRAVADTEDPIPEQSPSVNFASFHHVVIENSRVVFSATIACCS